MMRLHTPLAILRDVGRWREGLRGGHNCTADQYPERNEIKNKHTTHVVLRCVGGCGELD